MTSPRIRSSTGTRLFNAANIVDPPDLAPPFRQAFSGNNEGVVELQTPRLDLMEGDLSGQDLRGRGRGHQAIGILFEEHAAGICIHEDREGCDRLVGFAGESRSMTCRDQEYREGPARDQPAAPAQWASAASSPFLGSAKRGLAVARAALRSSEAHESNDARASLPRTGRPFGVRRRDRTRRPI